MVQSTGCSSGKPRFNSQHPVWFTAVYNYNCKRLRWPQWAPDMHVEQTYADKNPNKFCDKAQEGSKIVVIDGGKYKIRKRKESSAQPPLLLLHCKPRRL